MRALPSLLMTQFSKLYQDLLSFFGALVRTEYAVLMRFLCCFFNAEQSVDQRFHWEFIFSGLLPHFSEKNKIHFPGTQNLIEQQKNNNKKELWQKFANGKDEN